MKTCMKCLRAKPLSEFNNKASTPDGKRPWCKSCVAKQALKYGRTMSGLIMSIYHGQKTLSKKRGHLPPAYSRLELEAWLKGHKDFYRLYKAWQASGHESILRPSVDRLDNSKGYSFDNIRLVTWGENHDAQWK